jgi:hypothetical protein
MALYTDVGPLSGPLRSGTGYLAIRVLHARRAPTPIGAALLAGPGRDAEGRALWRLTIDTIDLPGFWVVVDRAFRPARRGLRRPRCSVGRPRCSAGRPRVPSLASLSRRDHNRPPSTARSRPGRSAVTFDREARTGSTIGASAGPVEEASP